MHPTLQEPVWGSDNFCKPAPQEIRNFNHQSADFNQKSKEYKPKKRRFPNQPDLSRYVAQHSNKSEHQLSKTEMSSQQSKDAACAENQGGFTACEFSSFCSEQPQWFDQLQLTPVSFCHGETSTTTYALIGHGSQFSFIVNEIADKLQIPWNTHQCLFVISTFIDHEMPVAKVDNAVHVSPHDVNSVINLCNWHFMQYFLPPHYILTSVALLGSPLCGVHRPYWLNFGLSGRHGCSYIHYM